MIVWRLVKRAWSGTPLDGEGARLFEGRWNSVGVPIVYTSTTLALAAFELLVHVGRDDLPDDLVAVKVHVPDDLPRSHLKPSQLPTNWASYRAPLALASLGDAWAAAGRTALLVVPSAAIPDSENVLINPLHKGAAGRIRVLSRKPFRWDRRLRPPTR